MSRGPQSAPRSLSGRPAVTALSLVMPLTTNLNSLIYVSYMALWVGPARRDIHCSCPMIAFTLALLEHQAKYYF